MIFRPEARRIQRTFDYLVAPAGPLPERSDVTVVFGRKSAHLVAAAVRAAAITGAVIVSGKVGKDSGDLPRYGIAEADYIAEALTTANVIAPETLYRDYMAKNGRGNARYSLRIMRQVLGLEAANTLVTVTHPTQVRRLGGTFALQAARSGVSVAHLHHYPSGYPFNAQDPFDQFEAAQELLRLDAQSRGMSPSLARPDDLPIEELEYASAVSAHLKKEFAAAGIRNPSTADDAMHAQHPLATMVLFAPSGASGPERLRAYAGNFIGLGMAAVRGS